MSKGRHRRHRKGRGQLEGVRGHHERVAVKGRRRSLAWLRRRRVEITEAEAIAEMRSA